MHSNSLLRPRNKTAQLLCAKMSMLRKKTFALLQFLDINKEILILLTMPLYPILTRPFSIKFNHFRLNNWHYDNRFQSFNQKLIEKDQNLSTRIKNRSKLDQISDHWLKITVEIRNGLKSTIEIGRLEIRIVDDSIQDP